MRCNFPLVALLSVGLLVAVGCKGPMLHVDNPDRHPTYVDGVATTAPSLPFRYYGTTRWDALPADRDGEADWTRQPASKLVTIEPPISPLLFPLDLPLQLVRWTFRGREDARTLVELPATPKEQLAENELANTELSALVERARTARVTR